MGQAADELRDADDIKEEIERTREDMAQTLDAIGERVSPRLQAERQVERLRRTGIEPKQMAAAAGLVLAVFLVLRRRGRRQDD